MEASLHKHDQLLTPFLVPFPSLEKWRMGLIFQASSCSLVFLEISPHPGAIQEPTQSCLIRTKDIPIIQKITKELLGALDQDWMLKHEISLGLLFTRILGALCQEPGGRDHCVFLITSQRLLNQGVGCV